MIEIEYTMNEWERWFGSESVESFLREQIPQSAIIATEVRRIVAELMRDNPTWNGDLDDVSTDLCECIEYVTGVDPEAATFAEAVARLNDES